MADIELVIKIPKDEYRWIIKSNETVFADVASKECMMHAIKNGTPLPKGHGKLIDADALYADLTFPTQQFAKAFHEILDDAQPIIPADEEDLGVCKYAPYGYDIDKCPFQEKGCKKQCVQAQEVVTDKEGD